MTDLKTVRASLFSKKSEVNSKTYQNLNNITTKDKFNLSDLEGTPVFVADDVALYTSTLPKGTIFSEVVASMAPPFNKFFIEFQKVPNLWDLYAWGTLVSVREDPKEIPQDKDDDSKPRWLLYFKTFVEKQKGHPAGPIAEHQAGLGEDGTWFRHFDGKVWWVGGRLNLRLSHRKMRYNQ